MVEKQKPGKVLMLPVDAIEPSPWQARTAFDDTEIAALAVSILQNGLLQPISVRRVGVRKYQLIAGERRLRACKLAKLEKVPAILADWTDSESAALGLLETPLTRRGASGRSSACGAAPRPRPPAAWA